jgi:hypothetical protein
LGKQINIVVGLQIRWERIDSDTSDRQRALAIDSFQNDPEVRDDSLRHCVRWPSSRHSFTPRICELDGWILCI